MFETLRTAFKVLASALTLNKLLIIGVVALVLMITWCVLSLVFNNTVKFIRCANGVMRFLRENSLTKENYAEFTRKMKEFPQSMRYAWKKYENRKEGMPSDYLNQYESLELPLFGGLQKQNRSLMRSAIYLVTAFLTILSIAIIGTGVGESTTKVVLTTTIFADAMIVPLVIFILLMINYYIYTTLRHNQYRTASDTFYDLIDVLDDRVDMYAIFGGDTRSIGLISNIYPNETMEQLAIEARKKRNQNSYQTQEVRIGTRSGLNPLKNGILGESNDLKIEENVISMEDPAPNKLSANENELVLDTDQDANFKIKNEVHFVEVVNCVEVLLNRAETEKNQVKKQAIEREINTLIKALTEYKQKAKAKQSKSRKKAGNK